jgi:hypothetical protein
LNAVAEVRFHRLAAREARLAERRYVGIDPDLGARFKGAVDHAAQRIAADPESYPIEYRNVRQVRVRRFPYVLVFAILSPDLVQVVAVTHTSRRPRYWRNRTP